MTPTSEFKDSTFITGENRLGFYMYVQTGTVSKVH